MIDQYQKEDIIFRIKLGALKKYINSVFLLMYDSDIVT